MKRIYLILIAAVAITFTSCSDRDMDTVKPDTGQGAPIINLPEGASQGKIMVKFKPEAASFLDAAVTRSIGGAMTRSGISDMDIILQRIGTHKLERIFPIDNRTEERTRKAGLNLWYVIHFDEDTNLEQVAKDLSQVADVAKVQFSHIIQRSYDPNVRATVLTKQAMSHVMRNTRAINVTPDDTYFNLQWGCKNDGSILQNEDKNDKGDKVVPAVTGVDVNCGEAWKLCTGDPSIIVAVLDEGVMYDHPDLKGNMWVNEAETFASKEDADGNGYAGDRYGYNFTDDKGYISYDDPNDTGHGTHVAGTIGAVGNNDIGIAGVCWNVKIAALKFGLDIASAIEAINFANLFHISILNASWGGRSYSQSLKYAIDHYQGLFIASAGNDGTDNDKSPIYPASYDSDNIITVASTSPDDSLSRFSNHGVESVDIAAPGSNILSLGLEDEYHSQNGTSMSAPHVAGAAALLKAYRPNLSVPELKNIILYSAVRNPNLTGKVLTGGVLNVKAMFELADYLQRCK